MFDLFKRKKAKVELTESQLSMFISTLIIHLNELVMDFSEQRRTLAVDFMDNKKFAEWTLSYNLIKLQFVLTKKGTLDCPKCTLFCRIYFRKNDTYFYHIPEIIEDLDPKDFKCYYFPYIESEERLDACFSILTGFIEKHFSTINALARDDEKCTEIRKRKLADMSALFVDDILPDNSNLNYDLYQEIKRSIVLDYEMCILLSRYAGESAYRDFLCGKYKKALKQYEKRMKKGILTFYEERLYYFIKGLETNFVPISDECNTVLRIRKAEAFSSECLSALIMAVILDILVGIIFAGIMSLINMVLSANTLYYAGIPWYYAFVFAGVPSVFGGIAFKHHIQKRLKKELYEETQPFDHFINFRKYDILAKMIWGMTVVGMLIVTICTSFMYTGFYDGYMVYNNNENILPIETVTNNYTDLKTIYYSEGLYNDYGDFIKRPSYQFEFENGEIWDSDSYMDVKEVEEYVLPFLELYYEEIENRKVKYFK